MKIYLAGGFYSDWRERIKEGAPNHQYIDPEFDYVPKQQSIMTYTQADLSAIDESDMVVAYLTNYPKYGGLAVEVGYAFAKGKPIILVSEKDDTDGMIVALSKWLYLSLEGAIWRLNKL
jgi:nucleoside 2-deoxyribosyltransferase